MTRRLFLTGGARGIGEAIAKRANQSGWEVIAPPRSALDLSDRSSVRNFLDRFQDTSVSALVNNAGQNVVLPFESLDETTWRQTFEVNLHSAFLLTQFFGRRMVEAGFGRIVNIGSLFSEMTRSGRAAYTASKTGLLGLTRSSAVEFADRGVLVNMVSPGFVETELTRANNSPERIRQIAGEIPVGRLAQPAEIADVVDFLISERNTYISGQNIIVDGAYSIQ